MKRGGIVQIVVTVLLMLVGVFSVLFFLNFIIKSPLLEKTKTSSSKILEAINQKTNYIYGGNSVDLKSYLVTSSQMLGIKKTSILDESSLFLVKDSIIITGGSVGDYIFDNLLDPLFDNTCDYTYYFDKNTIDFEGTCDIKSKFNLKNFNINIPYLEILNTSYYNLTISLNNENGTCFQIEFIPGGSTPNKVKVISPIEEREIDFTTSSIRDIKITKIENKLFVEFTSDKVYSTEITVCPFSGEINFYLKNVKIENPSIKVEDSDLPQYFMPFSESLFDEMLSNPNKVLFVYNNYFDTSIRGVTDSLKWKTIMVNELNNIRIDKTILKAVEESPFIDCIIKSGNYCVVFSLPFNKGEIIFVPYELIEENNEKLKETILKSLENQE